MLSKILRNRFFEPVLLFVFKLYMWGSHVEAFEWLVEFMESHEDWQLDEIFLAVVLLGSAGYIYAFRRRREKDQEMRKRISAETDLDWLSKHDNLTSLPNRHYLAQFVRRMNASTEKKSTNALGLISIDLDGFKKINDLMGHAAGDRLLIEVADRIQAVQGSKLVFRLGGDEFLAFVDISNGQDVEEVAKDIQMSLLAPYLLEGANCRVGVSMGTSLFPKCTPNLDEAIHYSDLAMYQAKRGGGNAICAFEPSMLEEQQRRSQLEQDLLQALADGKIVPHYQPLVNLDDGQIRGFEVLSRWQHPTLGNIAPDMFIALAEEIGAITELSDNVFRRACLDALAWPSHLTLSFNLSPLQITDRAIAGRLKAILDEVGFAPNRLEIEITENALIHDLEAATAVLDELRSYDVRIALDDFGTGYSNLSQLAKLKFDRIKIDRSFVNEFAKDQKQATIVKTILALGDGLGINTTAEGIEDEDQLELLRSLGCECGQGYLLGRPINADETQQLIDQIANGEQIAVG